jgi:hypothetical protein
MPAGGLCPDLRKLRMGIRESGSRRRRLYAPEETLAHESGNSKSEGNTQNKELARPVSLRNSKSHLQIV